MPQLRILWWSLGLVLLAIIVALSLLPISGPEINLPNSDKLNHALAYLVLTLYFGQLIGPRWRQRLLLIAALIAYGGAIEGLQSLLPPRTAEWADMAANMAGMAIGWLLLYTPLGRLLIQIETRLVTGPRL